MQVLFEDDGDLRAGTVRSSTDASLQVDSTTGKRVKVKAAAVLLRFEQPRAEELLTRAQAEAAGMDIDFLWQCAPQQEFAFEQLALEYCGREPSPVESAAILLRLHSAPIYFQSQASVATACCSSFEGVSLSATIARLDTTFNGVVKLSD